MSKLMPSVSIRDQLRALPAAWWAEPVWVRAASALGALAVVALTALVVRLWLGLFPPTSLFVQGLNDVLFGIGAFATIAALAGLGIVVYSLPTIVAVAVKSKSIPAVAIVNLFLGWTLVGWVAAFAIGLVNTTNKEPAVRRVGHMVDGSLLVDTPEGPRWVALAGQQGGQA